MKIQRPEHVADCREGPVFGGLVRAAAEPLLTGYRSRIGKQTSVTQLLGSEFCAGLTR